MVSAASAARHVASAARRGVAVAAVAGRFAPPSVTSRAPLVPLGSLADASPFRVGVGTLTPPANLSRRLHSHHSFHTSSGVAAEAAVEGGGGGDFTFSSADQARRYDAALGKQVFRPWQGFPKTPKSLKNASTLYSTCLPLMLKSECV